MSDDFDFDPNDLFDDFDDDDDFGNAIGDDDFGDFDDNDDGLGDFDDFDSDEFGAQLDFIDDDGEDEFEDEFDEFAEDEFATTGSDEGNRTFLYAAIGLGALSVIGILLILFIIFGPEDAQTVAFNASATARVIENETRQAQIEESATAAIVNVTSTFEAGVQSTQTAQADAQLTRQFEIEATATGAIVNLTETAEAIQQATQSAEQTATAVVVNATQDAAEAETQQAIELEMTLNPQEQGQPVILNGLPVLTADGSPVVLIDGEPFAIIDGNPVQIAGGVALQTSDGTPVEIVNGVPMAAGGDNGDATMPPAGEGVSISGVQQTATALALLFDATPTAQADLGGTQDSGSVGSIATTVPDGQPTAIPSNVGNEALPDTGLFDDVFGGNPLLIVLVAFGLLGVIVLSRSVRGSQES